MLNPVVVGVTGTSAGLAAVRSAAREAVSRGRPLRIVHALTWPTRADLDYDRARRQAAQAVDQAVATAQRSTPGVRVTGQILDGPAEQVLIRLSRSADLLVLGDDDLAMTPWLPPTSVLVQTVARAWCPVLVARGPRPPAGPVLAAVDGSPSTPLVLRQAAAEGARRRVRTEVVYVAREHDEHARQLLDRSLAAVPELGRPRILTGVPGETLVRASGKARLMVLGPRGAHDAGLLGTVARELLHHAACPTVFVHGRKLPGQRIPAPLSQRTRLPM